MTPRTVLVVGAGSGIGMAVAQQLSARGDRVVLVGRDGARLEQVAAALGGPTLVAPADITDVDAVEAAFAAAERAFGHVHGVVTTAQPMAYGTLEQVPPEVLGRMSEVAVVGTAHLARAALPRFRAAGGGPRGRQLVAGRDRGALARRLLRRQVGPAGARALPAG